MCYPLTDAEITRIAEDAVPAHEHLRESVERAIRRALEVAELRPECRKLPPPPRAPRAGVLPLGAVLTAVDPSTLAGRSYAGPHPPADPEE